MTSIDPAAARVDAIRTRTGDDAAAAARAAKADVEFRAMLLRELLRPLTEELLPDSDGTGFGGSSPEAGLGKSGAEMYGFFIEGALAEHLAERWPLPTADWARASTNSDSTDPLRERRGASIRISDERVPIALPATNGTALPLSTSVPARLADGPDGRLVGLPVPPGTSIVVSPRDAEDATSAEDAISSDSQRSPRRAETGSATPSISLEIAGSNPVLGQPRDRGGIVERNVIPMADEGSSVAMPAADEGSSVAMRSQVESRTDLGIDPIDPGRRPLLPELPDEQIQRAARLFDLPDSLVRAVILTESGGRADAVSPKGAIGLMQLMPGTARDMGVTNPRDPWENLYAGAKYLRRQLDRFGNLTEALAAYNAGPGAVERHGGVPPFRETREYVEKVLGRMRWLEGRD